MKKILTLLTVVAVILFTISCGIKNLDSNNLEVGGIQNGVPTSTVDIIDSNSLTVGEIKNGIPTLTIDKSTYLKDWSASLKKIEFGEISVVLGNLELVEEKGGLLLKASNADNTINTARVLAKKGNTIVYTGRSCTCVGCSDGCNTVVETNSRTCYCTSECENVGCTKTESQTGI